MIPEVKYVCRRCGKFVSWLLDGTGPWSHTCQHGRTCVWPHTRRKDVPNLVQDSQLMPPSCPDCLAVIRPVNHQPPKEPMLKERFQKVRAEVVEIDDKLYRAITDFESHEPNPSNVQAAAISSIGESIRSLLSILLRVIDSLP